MNKWRNYSFRDKSILSIGKLLLEPEGPNKVAVYCYTATLELAKVRIIPYHKSTYPKYVYDLTANGRSIRELFIELRIEIAALKDPKIKQVHEKMKALKIVKNKPF